MLPTLRAALLAALCCSFAVGQDAAGVHQAAVADTPTTNKSEPLAFGGLAYLELTATARTFHASLHVPVADAFGAILLSASPHQTYFQADLPPVLSQFAVLWVGFAVEGELELRLSNPMADDAHRLYGQAVLINPQGYWTSGLVPVARK